MPGIVEESVRQEKREYAPVSGEYIASQRERGQEATTHSLEQRLEAQKEFWSKVDPTKTEQQITSGMVSAEKSYIETLERYDGATLKDGIHPADAAFREGQRAGIKEFEMKHGLVEAPKIENLPDAITEKLRNAESSIEHHWITHTLDFPESREEIRAYHRGIADSVNALHSLIEKHAPELAQNLSHKIDFGALENRVAEKISRIESESISFTPGKLL